MPLRKTLTAWPIVVCLLFSIGCGQKGAPSVSAPVDTPAVPVVVEEDVGPSEATLDLRCVGIWATIKVPAKTTLVSTARDECTLQSGTSFSIQITRLVETFETVKSRYTEAKTTLIDLNDNGFTVTGEKPTYYREVWRDFNPYQGGYRITVNANPKLSAKQLERMQTSINSFTMRPFTIEEITKSQQAIADLKLAGIQIHNRTNGVQVEFPLRATTEKLLSRLPEIARIRHLHLVGPATVNANQLKTIASCVGISSLHLDEVIVNNTDWVAFDGQNSLQEIHFGLPSNRPKASPEQTKVVLAKLTALPLMRSVILRRHDVDEAVIKFANQLHKPRFQRIGFEEAGLSDTDVAALSAYRDWQGFSFADNPIRLDSIGYLREMKKLEYLDLTGCRVTDRMFATVGDLPLKTLLLTRTDVSNFGVQTISTTFPKLEKLHLAVTPITDDSLKDLAKLTNLKDLNIGNTLVNKIGLDQLSPCAGLRAINLVNLPINNADLLKQQEVFKNLEFVDVRCTGIDAETADKLQKAKPECTYLLQGTPSDEPRTAEAEPSSLVTVPVPLDKLPAADPEAMLKKFDGKFTRDDNAAEKPIVEISIASVEMTNEDLAHLRYLKGLSLLRIDGCDKITEAGLAYLKDLPALKTLYLANTRVTPSVCSVLASMKSLTTIVLPDITLNRQQLQQLDSLKNLEEIRGIQVGQYQEAFVEFLAKCKNLKRFDWGIVTWNNRRLAKLKEATKIEIVELQGNFVNDAGIGVLANFSHLKELTIHNDLLTDSGLKSLEKLSELKKLTIEGQRFGDGVLNAFRNHAELESLHISCPNWTDRGVSGMRSFPKLLELDVSSNRVGDPLLSQLSELKDLEWINLNDTLVTDAGFKHLKNMEELRTLSLRRTTVNGSGFKELLKLPRLSRLELGGTIINLAGLTAIAEITSIEEIDLSSININDEAILKLQKLPGLRNLNLNGNQAITDALAEKLVQFPALTDLSVVGSKFTAKGLTALRKKDGLTVISE